MKTLIKYSIACITILAIMYLSLYLNENNAPRNVNIKTCVDTNNAGDNSRKVLNEIAKIPFFKGAKDLIVVDSIAYVVTDNNLIILNFSKPSQPNLLGYYTIKGNVTNFYIKDNNAYLANTDRGLRIIDLSNPKDPVEAGFYEAIDGAYNVYVSGDYAYVTDQSKNIRIINISNPKKPYSIRTIYTKSADNVVVKDHYIYLSGYEEFGVIDISNIKTPKKIVEYQCRSNNMRLEDNYAFIIIGKTINIMDISNPDKPKVIGTYENAYSIDDFEFENDYIYIMDRYEGLTIISISNPVSPFLVNYYPEIKSQGIYVSNGCVYLADDNYVRKINAINVDNLFEEGYYYSPGHVDDIRFNSNYVYLAFDNQLISVDVSNKENPQIIGYYNNPENFNKFTTKKWYISKLYVYENYAFFAGMGNGLEIIDITNPSQLEKIADILVDNEILDVFVRNTTAYVLDGYGLHIFDISNIYEPWEVFFLEAYAAQSIYVQDEYAYIHCQTIGLKIIDISSEYFPEIIGSWYNHYSNSWNMVTKGNYAYLANGYRGLLVLHINSKKHPKEIASTDIPGFVWDIIVDDDYAYVACGSGGLKVYDVSDKSSIKEIKYYDDIVSSHAISLSPPYIYLADYSGFYIFEL